MRKLLVIFLRFTNLYLPIVNSVILIFSFIHIKNIDDQHIFDFDHARYVYKTDVETYLKRGCRAGTYWERPKKVPKFGFNPNSRINFCNQVVEDNWDNIDKDTYNFIRKTR